jgi:hypothetical protein
MTTLEKKKEKEKDFSSYFRDLVPEIRKLNKEEADTQKKKKEKVMDVAMRLEQKEDIAIEKICRIIIKYLKVELKPRTIREYLPDKYKSPYRSMNAKKQKKRPLEHVSTPSLAAVPPLNQEEGDDDKEILVIDRKDALSIDDGTIQPFSPVDISMMDLDLVRRSTKSEDWQPLEQDKTDRNTTQYKCLECPKKDIKIDNLVYENLELKETIEKSEKFTTADKLFDNKKENSFEFVTFLKELNNKIQEILSLQDNTDKVRIKVVVDPTTGETKSLFCESATS